MGTGQVRGRGTGSAQGSDRAVSWSSRCQTGLGSRDLGLLLYVWASKRAKWPAEPHKHLSPHKGCTRANPWRRPLQLSAEDQGMEKWRIIHLSHLSGHRVPAALQTHSLICTATPGGGRDRRFSVRLREGKQRTQHHTANPRTLKN